MQLGQTRRQSHTQANTGVVVHQAHIPLSGLSLKSAATVESEMHLRPGR